MSDESLAIEEEQKIELKPKVRLVFLQNLDSVTFVGRDVLAMAHDIYIDFFNFKNKSEIIYTANNHEVGDGVDCVTGHKSNIFAFAEKRKDPRILIVSYPMFAVLAKLSDPEVVRYKGLCMLDGDLVMSFSGFPNYITVVWNWRIGQRLIAVETGVTTRRQLFLSSKNQTMVCECWNAGVCVWDVCPCYKNCLLMKRLLNPSRSDLIDIVWTIDGQLYAIDDEANLFSLASDGIGLVCERDWKSELTGDKFPRICSFGVGVIIYGPDGVFRALKRIEKAWKAYWSWSASDGICTLISNTSADVVAICTQRGFIYKVTTDGDDVKVTLFAYKQRNILKAQIIAPDNNHIATLNNEGVMCLYNVSTGTLVSIQQIGGNDVSLQSSPVDPLIVVTGEIGPNYGMMFLKYQENKELLKTGSMSLTHQIISRIVFSSNGRYMIAAAMSAGHIFIFKIHDNLTFHLVRYAELGRGLADCTLARVGNDMRAFSLMIFSDKYSIGERIVCINADTGKDNKFAGKMQGPYSRLVPLLNPGTMVAIPHQATEYHLLTLTADKGVTVSVKINSIVESGHELRYYNGDYNDGAFVTFGYDGFLVVRKPEGPAQYDLKLITTHRYNQGVREAIVDTSTTFALNLSVNGNLSVHYLDSTHVHLQNDIKHVDVNENMFNDLKVYDIMNVDDKTYLELQEEKKRREEALDYKTQRDEITKAFQAIQATIDELIEENNNAPPLHQLPLDEFDLNVKAKQERQKQIEKEDEENRINTEAMIKAMQKVTAWIKEHCWDVVLTPRVKLFAIFSHYQVENYPVLPTQRDNWPELQQIEALRTLEMEKDDDVFKPWINYEEVFESERKDSRSVATAAKSGISISGGRDMGMISDTSSNELSEIPILYGSLAPSYIDVPKFVIPQTMAFSYLQMNWVQQILKLNTQNLRLWFNKQFDDLMNQKKREMSLVIERNNRLRFIVSELNKLSDLRGSFHHLNIMINNPEWKQDEQPHRLVKVDPEECSIPPYISPSQIVIIPPEVLPKELIEFRERALMEMMDGVLEKLWHEEIKKPIPKPLCMLEKEPENFTENDLRLVFDYEAKVEFRNQEREKYRKMLHAEYAKLSATLNEGIVKFNMKVKDMWLTKLKIDSIIAQENMKLMRLRRINLDRLEDAEKLEHMRDEITKYEAEVEVLNAELKEIHVEKENCQSQYDALLYKDKAMDKNFKNPFADLSPIIVDQCYKFFKRRPKWHQRATMSPCVLNELASAIATAVKPPLLHADCHDYFKGVETLDSPTNMPAVMDEQLWATTCRLRRAKIENEIRMRALVQELAQLDSNVSVWNKAIAARKLAIQKLHNDITTHREHVEHNSRNKTVQIVLPAGQVEIEASGHFEDFNDAILIPRADIDAINNLILKVGELKLKLMKKQMEFRKGIMVKEFEHAQMKLKLKHMEEELYAFERMKLPKELQFYLRNKAKGITDEEEFVRMEKDAQATHNAVMASLNDVIQKCEDLEVRTSTVETEAAEIEKEIADLNVQLSEKDLRKDPLQPLRERNIAKKRMETIVTRSRLVREVQELHSHIVLLQTQLELLRLKTYPTLASFRTYCA